MYFARIYLPAHLTEDDIGALADAYADISQGSISKRVDQDDSKPWLMEWYFEDKPDASFLTAELLGQPPLQGHANDTASVSIGNDDFEIDEVAQENWLEKVYQEYPPFSVGPFFIYGSHYEDGVPEGQIGILIDAATAFGSGEHGTTKGCLRAMLDLKGKGQCPWNILDMGTGSGILSIAAWKLWQTSITAVDIDEESIRVTKRYQEINGVKDGKGAMQCEAGDGFATPIVSRRAPYDLIIANILAGPLIDMAADLKAVSDENGTIVLSGMLHRQVPDVQGAYEAQGFTLQDRIDIDKWSTLVMHNDG